MLELFSSLNRKLNHLVWTTLFSGVVILLLGLLTVWYDLVVRLVIGLFLLVNGYVLIYVAWKLWQMKKDIEKHFKL
jgi:hypothetical protein